MAYPLLRFRGYQDEPDGSITKYYAFVSEDTKNILESLMAHSDNYYECVLKLGEEISRKTVSEELAFIAAAHAWRIQDIQLLSKIREKYADSPIVIGFTFPTTSIGDRIQYCDEVRNIVATAMKGDLPDWMSVKLLVHQGYFCATTLSSSDSFDNLNKAREQIASNSDLDCFLLNIKFIEGILQGGDGDMTGALLSFSESLELARKYNHQYLLSSSLRGIGNILRHRNPSKSVKYQEEANAIINRLSVPQRMHEIRNYHGLTCWALGEYDLALEAFLSSLEVYDSGSGPDDTTSFNLARL